jgi:hypothetical protein
MMVAPTVPIVETIEVTQDLKLDIPPDVVRSLGLRPGQKLRAIFYTGSVEVMPIVYPRDLRGALPELDTTVERDEDRI